MGEEGKGGGGRGRLFIKRGWGRGDVKQRVFFFFLMGMTVLFSKPTYFFSKI